MELTGWGRFPRAEADFVALPGEAAIRARLAGRRDSQLIPRGGGRSYGDSALAPTVLSSRYLDHYFGFNREELTLHCAAGLNLGDILDLIVPHGAFLPVLPGTRFVTVGGAIAADIHGKNHHVDGTFCDHVLELRLALASGEVVRCSPDENAELFAATCGGMGLTGMVVDARLRLIPVSSGLIANHTIAGANLVECLAQLEENRHSKYVVAWLDCLARGDRLGRGIVYLGEHVEEEQVQGEQAGPARRPTSLSVPFSTPGFLLNRYTMAAFNRLYYRRQRHRPRQQVPYHRYFFPLDRVRHWNRLYGGRGLLQYQLVLPEDSAAEGAAEILARVADSGLGSFLSVLKQFGQANGNLLSFPRAGITLALDFKATKAALALLDSLDNIVLAHGGRLYLAKDARMSEAMFKAGYPDWEKFLHIKREVDPDNRFTSLQARRLGLTEGSDRS